MMFQYLCTVDVGFLIWEHLYKSYFILFYILKQIGKKVNLTFDFVLIVIYICA